MHDLLLWWHSLSPAMQAGSLGFAGGLPLWTWQCIGYWKHVAPGTETFFGPARRLLWSAVLTLGNIVAQRTTAAGHTADNWTAEHFSYWHVHQFHLCAGFFLAGYIALDLAKLYAKFVLHRGARRSAPMSIDDGWETVPQGYEIWEGD